MANRPQRRLVKEIGQIMKIARWIACTRLLSPLTQYLAVFNMSIKLAVYDCTYTPKAIKGYEFKEFCTSLVIGDQSIEPEL